MMPSTDDLTALCWLDLETSGTNEATDPILELGIVVTDPRPPFATVTEMHAVIRPWLTFDGWMTRMEEVVVKMHTDNGLIAEVERSVCTAGDAEELALTILSAHAKPHRVALCGSGVGHFDRRFLRAQMPKLEKFFPYWVIDVGVLRRSLRLFGIPDRPPPSNGKAHRALDDARDHLEEFRFYADMLRTVDHITAMPR